ncbi:hypothetical protein [Massilia sp. PWRC2]|uniref:hypothetical protein n=1 Tax=Massilia sp. PWRC2 TaxID=2804626 RepID=UPI003CF2928C
MAMLPQSARSFALISAVPNSKVITRLAYFLVPLMLGLLSLGLGQDDNWDLKNYHLYNAFAFLNGKIGFDLAPAQWQSYFNPTLDLVYYGLSTSLPAPVAGLLMGILHGLNFLLVFGICRQVLPAMTAPHRFGATMFLSLAAMLSPGFLAQIGNSMGDNMTSLFVLGAVWLLLHNWQQLYAGASAVLYIVMGSGLIMGLGCGLKLTNATYAVALCLGLFMLSGSLAMRTKLAFAFGVGVLAGIAISAGHWFALMYHTFGNPLFPQFNNHFLAPLAAPIGVGDTGWLPKNWSERIFWPFIFALNPRRVGELQLRLWIWPVLYVGMLAFAARAIFIIDAHSNDDAAALALRQRQRLLLTFVAASYLVWLSLFSIYRYLVPIELLAPLAVWLIAAHVLPSPWSSRIAIVIISLCVIAGIPRASWGHAGWTRDAFTAAVPVLADPRESMVLTVHGDPPLGWLVTRFPATLAFVAIGSGFPESAAFVAKVKQMARARTGPLFAMMQADRADPAAPRSAAQLQSAADENRATVKRASELVGQYGFKLDPASCTMYQAAAGTSRWNYQLCTLTLN